MRAYILLSILTIFWLFSFSQKWEHIYGNPEWYEGSEDITEAYDKGYLVLGNTGYNDHGWLFKTDINGDMLWEKYFGGTGQVPGFICLTQDNEGNIYIAGKMKFNEIMPTTIIFKLNQCGELSWCKTFYMENYENCRLRDIIVYNDSTLICLARHNDPEEDKSIYLYSINSITGNINWKKPYAVNSQHPLLATSFGVRLYLFDDLFIIAGDCYWAYPNSDTTHFYLRPFFIGIDTLFKEKWILPIGVNDSMIGTARGAVQLSDSVMVGFGRYKNNEGGEMKNNSILMFFDKNGNELGYNGIKNSSIGNDIEGNQIGDMRWINDSLLFASISYRYDDDDIHFCDVKTDTSATVHKVEMVDINAGDGGISNMIKTHDGKYVVTTGYIENNIGDIYLYKKNSDLEHDTVYPGYYNYDSLCEEQIVSNTISLGGCDIIVNIKEVPTLEEYNADKGTIHIVAFPNPVLSNKITLQFKNTNNFSNLELKFYNMFGKLIHNEVVYQYQGASKIEVQNWQEGMYIALVFSNGKVVGQVKFVVQ